MSKTTKQLLATLFLASLDVICVVILYTNGFTRCDHRFNFRQSVFDLLVFSIFRAAILIGASIGLATSHNKAAAIAKMKRTKFIISLLATFMGDFSLVKLLAISEVHDVPWVQKPWETAVLAANLLFSISLFVVWRFVLCREQSLLKAILSPAADSESQTNLHEDTDTLGKATHDLEFHQNKTLIFRLFAYCRHEWKWYLLGFSSLTVFAVSKIFIPYFTGDAVSAIVTGESYNVLVRAIAIMAGLSAVSTISAGFRGGLCSYAGNKVNLRIRNELFNSIVNQEIGFFDVSKTGDITSRLTADTQTMSTLVSANMNFLLRNVIQLIGALIFMFKISWRLAVLNFICVPIMTIVSDLYGRYYEKLSKECQTTLAKANEVADEVISNIRTVRSFANETQESDRYADKLKTTLKVYARQCIAYTFYIWNSEFLSLTILVGVLWYGGHLVSTNKMKGPDLISFLLYQMQLATNIEELSYVFTSLMEAAGASAKVFEYIDRKPNILNNGTEKQATVEGFIQFDNVSFSYPSGPNSQVLSNISFKVSPGEVVALVGPSGGGKSTCFSLLQHFYEPNNGRILLDDVQVDQLEHKLFHKTIAVVSQEPALFGCSIRDNITYGLEEYLTDEQIVNAAKQANAHDFIDQLKDKYETQAGERGVQLSGGQKQRVAIARALIRKPKILLLDEATSALDADSEFKVQEAIYQNLKGHTVLLIAHRLSTVEKANRILVINNGKLVQNGTHTELLNEDGVYRNLIQRQLIGATSSPICKPVFKPGTGGSPSTTTTESDILNPTSTTIHNLHSI